MSAHNGVTTGPTSNVERRVGFQGPNMKGQCNFCPESYTGSHRNSERDEKKESGHLGKKEKRAGKLLASVGRKKEEDKRNKSNDLEIKKSASKENCLGHNGWSCR